MDSTSTTDQVVTRVGLIAPQLANFDPDAVELFAADAYDKAIEDGFTGNMAIRAAGYLAAHFVNMANAQNDNVKSESAAVLSREYFDRGSGDSYLDEYNRMLASQGGAVGGAAVARFS